MGSAGEHVASHLATGSAHVVGRKLSAGRAGGPVASAGREDDGVLHVVPYAGALTSHERLRLLMRQTWLREASFDSRSVSCLCCEGTMSIITQYAELLDMLEDTIVPV